MSNRRTFIQKSSLYALGASSIIIPTAQSNANHITQPNDNINEIGPKKGYTPQIGTLVSMMSEWCPATE